MVLNFLSQQTPRCPLSFRANAERPAQKNAQSGVGRDPPAGQLSGVLHPRHALPNGRDPGCRWLLRSGRDELIWPGVCRRGWQVSVGNTAVLLLGAEGGGGGHDLCVALHVSRDWWWSESGILLRWCAGTWQSGCPMATPPPTCGHWTSSALATCRVVELSCDTESWKSCVSREKKKVIRQWFYLV